MNNYECKNYIRNNFANFSITVLPNNYLCDALSILIACNKINSNRLIDENYNGFMTDNNKIMKRMFNECVHKIIQKVKSIMDRIIEHYIIILQKSFTDENNMYICKHDIDYLKDLQFIASRKINHITNKLNNVLCNDFDGKFCFGNTTYPINNIQNMMQEHNMSIVKSVWQNNTQNIQNIINNNIMDVVNEINNFIEDEINKIH